MARVQLRVQPRASREEVVGERGGAIVVRVTAAPAEGAANDAVRRLVAKRIGVAKGSVEIVRGARGRDKLLEVDGLAAAEVRRRLLRSDGR